MFKTKTADFNIVLFSRDFPAFIPYVNKDLGIK